MAKRKKTEHTEGDWLIAQQPDEMMAILQTRFSIFSAHYERRIRLYAASCCRRIWDHLIDEVAKAAVVAAERFADGEISEEQSYEAAERVRDRILSHRAERVRCALRAATYTADAHPIPQRLFIPGADQDAARAVSAKGTTNVVNKLWVAERTAQTDLLRCIFGNPFRPVAFSPAWRSESAVALARTAYDTRNFTLLPILADALEEAGCDHADILAHCRDPKAVHARGCWVVDLVLNKS